MSIAKQESYFVHPLMRAREWQHRPQLDSLCQWWREDRLGVYALVGMGGSGKTAIAERFLHDLVLGKTDTSSRPFLGGVFVYSFYDDDKPENFFWHLQIWLDGDADSTYRKSQTQLKFDLQRQEGLMVLDGIERIQECGARGGFGRLTCSGIREVLNLIASGVCPDLSTVVTSRFPLTDLRDRQHRFFHTLEVDEIETEAGISLLRARGVRGTDLQLSQIVKDCGGHALTIDLAGGYISEYRHGDPSIALNLGDFDGSEFEAELDDDKRALMKQGVRFARIAQQYRESMLRSDEAALALLERICLFRLGVDFNTLAEIFTGPTAAGVSGKALSSLNAGELQRKVDWLVRLRIVEAVQYTTERKTVEYRYTVHPAVRDGFLSGITRDDVRTSHDAIRQKLEVSLGKAPNPNPSKPAELDLIEEIIHHAIATCNTAAAWHIYQHRLGGCHNLLARLNDYVRTSRVTKAILESHAVQNDLGAEIVIILRSDFGYSCLELGDIRSALLSLSIGFEECLKTRNANIRTLSRNLACALQQAGHLVEAIDVLERALPLLRDPTSILHALWQQAEIRNLCGEVQITITEELFDRYAKGARPGKSEGSLPLTVRHESLDVHRDLEKILAYVDECAKEGEDADFVQARLALSGRYALSGKTEQALELCSAVHDWAIAKDSQRIMCQCLTTQTRVLLSQALNGEESSRSSALLKAQSLLARGLKMSSDCGYSLHHIDLLLERSQLHLLQGNARAAIDDIDVALETGVRSNEDTGQLELFSARNAACQYVWAVPVGQQLRAESLLHLAAVKLGSNTIERSLAKELPLEVVDLIEEAERQLSECLEQWHRLRDPAPSANNIIHGGKEYNQSACHAFKVMDRLSQGLLTIYPLQLPETELKSWNTTGEKVDGLVKVANCDRASRVVDVVFVHGLDGDAVTTWHPPSEPRKFWPAWLGQDLPQVGVWSLNYAVASSAWKGHSMPLYDRATSTLDLFDLDGIGKRPIVFVCHSLGGLLVKQALRQARESKNPDTAAIAQNTKVIVFLSTPHTGAGMANWIQYIGSLLRSTVSVEELEEHHPRLRELNTWYRNSVGDLGIKTFVYCEKLATKGVLVVNETTADPGIEGVTPVPLSEDHITICKPADKQSQVYRRVKRLIEECLPSE